MGTARSELTAATRVPGRRERLLRGHRRRPGRGPGHRRTAGRRRRHGGHHREGRDGPGLGAQSPGGRPAELGDRQCGGRAGGRDRGRTGRGGGPAGRLGQQRRAVPRRRAAHHPAGPGHGADRGQPRAGGNGMHGRGAPVPGRGPGRIDRERVEPPGAAGGTSASRPRATWPTRLAAGSRSSTSPSSRCPWAPGWPGSPSRSRPTGRPAASAASSSSGFTAGPPSPWSRSSSACSWCRWPRATRRGTPTIP
jgi:hypothetical protein